MCSSVYSCYLLVSSAPIRSLPFLSFIVPILAWNVPLISPILFKRSLVFPILLFSSVSVYYSLKKAFFFKLILITFYLTITFQIIIQHVINILKYWNIFHSSCHMKSFKSVVYFTFTFLQHISMQILSFHHKSLICS